MAKCEVCGKGKVFFKQVSHSHKISSKAWKPNLRTVKTLVNGENKKITMCAKCLRTSKLQKN